jgi:DNA modification methylase
MFRENEMSEYQEFLASKQRKPIISGFEVKPEDINEKLFLFQRDIVRWALRLGKAAIFAECGLGKTPMQLEWARHVAKSTKGKVLILAPLAVSAQTVREGAKFGINAVYVQDQESVEGINCDIFITNYERLDKFDCSFFSGVVLDESSILKSFSNKIYLNSLEVFANTPYKLACTATPSPNDVMELTNHAEFLDVMTREMMLTTFFVHDSGKTSDWRLKKHGRDKFWDFVTSWAVSISCPRDMGDEYDMPGFDLPPLNIIKRQLPAGEQAIERANGQGMLFPVEALGLNNVRQAKRDSLQDRIAETVNIVNSLDSKEPILIWCELNAESDALIKAIPEATEVRGNQKTAIKESRLLGFADGTHRILVTKTKIAGFGLNYQHCHNMIFMSGSFSFEKTYQGLRRSWRFGQEHPVDAYSIYAETEGNLIETLARKRKQFDEMQQEMNAAMLRGGLFRNEKRRELVKVDHKLAEGKGWQLHLGDCVEETRKLPDDSIGFSVYSPPFSSLFVYSDSDADMGNSSDDDEFFEHYGYFIREKLRITKPGRLTAVHCSDLPTYKWRDGHIGIKDFSGQIIAEHLKHGWVYHSRVTIWKDPVVEMQRTKANGLLHKQFVKNTAACRVGIPDYLLIFRKWDNIDDCEPVTQNRIRGDYIGEDEPTDLSTNYSIDLWQRYASPVWNDIRQGRVLNYRIARSAKDEKHICPLQLDVIGRSIDLWSNPGDTVFSPFAGIGSEGYEAVKMGRKFIGIELKPEYHKIAVDNLKEAERQSNQVDLFSFAGIEVETKEVENDTLI